MPFTCCSPVVPLLCPSAKALHLDCLSHLFHIVRPCLIHTCHAVSMPFPCLFPNMPWMCLSVGDLTRPWQVHGRVATAGWWHIDGRVMACLRLASLWPLLLPRPVSGSLLSEAYQSQIAVASVNGTVVAGWWQGNGMGTAWERHGMCESAFTLLSYTPFLHLFLSTDLRHHHLSSVG
jgi:hypothetical protein